jgi:hypothetical protein
MCKGRLQAKKTCMPQPDPAADFSPCLDALRGLTEGRGFTGCGKTRLCRHSERSFGVRSRVAGPLWLEPACWRAMMLSVAIPASKLAGRKAAASCRTPKRAAPARAVVALSACSDEFFRSL